ncbi:MAG: hypothetical protein OHK0023_12470 [Anaerolineae bacterium]
MYSNYLINACGTGPLCHALIASVGTAYLKTNVVSRQIGVREGSSQEDVHATEAL